MKHILLDTQVFLWMQLETDRLPRKIRSMMHTEEYHWHLSQVSVWEIQVKYDLGKLPLPKPPQEIIPKLISDSGLAYSPLKDEAIFMLGKLPPIHRDPFDRLLIATAIVEGWELATADDAIKAYPVRILAC